MTELLRVAVVGASNMGKTSLVAALCRDATLEIDDRPGTTLSVQEEHYKIGEVEVLTFVDTPGFDDPAAINAWLDDAAGPSTGSAPDGRTLVERFLAEAEGDHFRSEKRALEGALTAGVLVYTANADEPVTGQKRQSLRLLRRLGIPVIVVLNRGDEAGRGEWTEMVRREGIDAIVRLDAWEFPADAEEAFYDALAVVQPDYRGRLDEILRLRDQLREERRLAAAGAIAELLVDALAYRITEEAGTRREGQRRLPAVEARFRDALVAREQALFAALMEGYGFGRGADVDGASMDDVAFDGGWTAGLFDPEVVRRYGASIGSLALAGAAAGAPFEAFGTHGLSAAFGAAVGAGAGVFVGRWRAGSVDRAGTVTAGPLEATQMPVVLVNRAVEAWREIDARSHARTDTPALTGKAVARGADIAALRKLAKKCRKRPEWSAIGDGGAVRDAARAGAAEAFATLVEPLLKR